MTASELHELLTELINTGAGEHRVLATDADGADHDIHAVDEVTDPDRDGAQVVTIDLRPARD